MLDLLFRQISVIDGTGRKAFTADIGVKEGKIIINPTIQDASEVISGDGLTLCPGFIDAHSHGDQVFGTDYGRICKVSQGITTELTGQCGHSHFPFSSDPTRAQMLVSAVGEMHGAGLHFYPKSMAEYLSWLKGQKLSCNCKIMVGHCALRIAAMGMNNRTATEEELQHMKKLLREAMGQGAAGMSSGLIYSPSCYADEYELTELCKVVAEFDGLYATHMRNEGSSIVDSIAESIRIAERAGCRLNISHHKVCGRDNWGLSELTLSMIHQAISRGVRITMDVYPYTASMTTLNVCLPSSFFSNGAEKMTELLNDSQVRNQLRQQMELEDGRYKHCGFEKILIVKAPATPDAIGKTIAEYAACREEDPFESFFDLVRDNGRDASAIYFSMNEEELQKIMLDENAVVGTDGLVYSMTGATHPRGFGSFPKAIRYFVREKGLLTLEQMIHKMTQLPAQRLLVPNKGVIAEGYDADLVLFRANDITDRAEYQCGYRLSDGIERVFVAGKTVFKNHQLTDETPGCFIPHP